MARNTAREKSLFKSIGNHATDSPVASDSETGGGKEPEHGIQPNQRRALERFGLSQKRTRNEIPQSIGASVTRRAIVQLCTAGMKALHRSRAS
mmetsp:Transcript_10788/g.25558  ORF Transcript_10788/g.25558 Transcript_10788/m.25558 type:complete len:93 (+) Transcript_10788:937-1215(+)